MVPVVTQSPRAAYPMGGRGRQKVRPLSKPSGLVSRMAPAGPTACGWLLQICMNVVVRASGLHEDQALWTPFTIMGFEQGDTHPATQSMPVAVC